MVSYRRKRYGRRRSTNLIKMKFQTFMDISTSDSSMQIITISAGGKSILQRLAPQFGAYKYYKIGNIAVKLVPASTLPVDPTGLSYEAGDTTVDPRDQLTPGMMRITNGEDIFEDITGLTEDQQRGIYNNMLLDPRWYKWMLQSGVKRHATPRYWQIGQLHQDKWPGSTANFPMVDSNGNLAGTAVGRRTAIYGSQSSHFVFESSEGGASSPLGIFQTGHRGVLGWMPTDGYQSFLHNITRGVESDPLLASPPEVEVMKIILPRAFKTKYYYRVFITETVYFRDPIVNFGLPYTTAGGSVVQYRPLDVFRSEAIYNPTLPGTGIAGNVFPDNKTGGNYGDD